MKLSVLPLLGLALVLGACDHYSTKLASLEAYESDRYHDVSAIAPAAGGSYLSDTMTFRNYLINEYMQLAIYENNVRRDYKAAKYYTTKVEQLEDGKMVAPASFRDFNVEPDKYYELQAARSEFIQAMETYNIPENRYSLARAQSRYDCWMDQVEDEPENKTPSCEAEFREAMSSLIAPEYYYSDDAYYDTYFGLAL